MIHLLSHRARREHQHDHEDQRCYVHKSSHKILLRFVPREPRSAMLTYTCIRLGGSYRIVREQGTLACPFSSGVLVVNPGASEQLKALRRAH
jgi:hypothetical protein